MNPGLFLHYRNKEKWNAFFACVFELGASHLQSRHSTTWATSPVHFAEVILEMGV
jgi:hypothetical protein